MDFVCRILAAVRPFASARGILNKTGSQVFVRLYHREFIATLPQANFQPPRPGIDLAGVVVDYPPAGNNHAAP